MAKRRTRNIHDDRGASLVEYALLVTLIAVMGMASTKAIGVERSASFETAAAGIDGQRGTSEFHDQCDDGKKTPECEVL